jgi:hypothetical protein
MKIQYFLLPAVVIVSPLYANEPAEVRELATTYMTLRNEKKYDEIIANCLFRDRVTDPMLQATRQILEFGFTIQSFKIEKATDQDKQLFREGVVHGDHGRLYSNLDPAWVIVFSRPALGATPASTERVTVGQVGDKWRIAMLVPKKN